METQLSTNINSHSYIIKDQIQQSLPLPPKAFLPPPCWVVILKELTQVLGYSYSRIAFRLTASPSAIQKLIRYPNRIPRNKIFFALSHYYIKLFYSQNRSAKAKQYLQSYGHQTLRRLIQELAQRDYFEIDEFNANEEEFFLIQEYQKENN